MAKLSVANKKHRKAVRNPRKKKAGGIQLYANPYDISAKGWYFKDADDFDAKYKKHLPVEEYEIEFIDGTREEADLFKAMGVNQGNVREFLDVIGQLDNEHDQAAFYYVVEQYPSKHKSDPEGWAEALEKVEDEVRVMEGDSKAYAEEYIDNIGGVGQLDKKTVEMYFDYEAFGSALEQDLNPDEEGDRYYLDMNDYERGEAYVDSIGFDSLGKAAEEYFDMDKFARDLDLGGDVSEFVFAGKTWTTDYHG